MKTAKVKCSGCGKMFEKKIKYINRAPKREVRHCCSRSCAARLSNGPGKYNPSIRLYAGNKRDEYTPFRYFMVGIRSRTSNQESYNERGFDIDEKYLKKVWDEQHGKCIYTGWDLILPDSAAGWKDKKKDIRRASVDRIDNDKGYIKGNIRFVSVVANYARNTFSDDEIYQFCDSVVGHRKIS